VIIYFTDRRMNILGQASTDLPQGLVFSDDVKTEEISVGVKSFQCRMPYTEETRKEVESVTGVGNYLLMQDGDESSFYTIIETENDTATGEVYILAEDAGMDLLNEINPAYEADKAYPISHYINYFAVDTGFEIGVNEVSNLSRKLSWEGEATTTARILSVGTQFDAEISYSFVIENMKVTKKFINVYKQRGKDIGVGLRLNRDINRIRTSKSIANLATGLLVKGGTPEGEETPITLNGFSYDDGRFWVAGSYLFDRESNAIWSRYLMNQEEGNSHIVQPFSYDTLSKSELCNRAVSRLKRLSQIEVNYEVDISILPANIRIGDTIRIVDDNGELYLSARVLKMETSKSKNEAKATLGNYLIQDSGISQRLEELAEEFKSIAKARPLYTWIVYADTQAGNGISLSPTNKKYMGTATNQFTDVVDISDPSVFSWALIKGADGVDGTDGVNGKTMFTWVKYADSPTTGMADTPTGKKFIGFAYNKETATESTNYHDYTWSPVNLNGENGNEVFNPTMSGMMEATSSYTQFGWSANSTHFRYITPESDFPTDFIMEIGGTNSTTKQGWSRNIPVIPGQTLSILAEVKTNIPTATRTVVQLLRFFDDTKPANATAQADTVGGNSYVHMFNDGHSLKGAGVIQWNNELVKALTVNKWGMFSYSVKVPEGASFVKIGYYNGNAGTTTRVWGRRPFMLASIAGEDGERGPQGVTGPKGADGTPRYTWLKYADSPTSGMSDSPTNKKYIGLAYNKTTATESSNYADYTWSLMQGVKGDTGVAGPKGADGTQRYTWIKYATSATGASMSDSPTNRTYIGIAYNKTTATESNNAADYTWSLIQGAKGDTGATGATGRGISGTAIAYQASSSGTTVPTGTWVASPPSVSANQFLWTRTVLTYSSGSPATTTSYSVGRMGANGATGATGATGTAGRGISSTAVTYRAGTSGTTVPSGTWTTTVPSVADNQYLWTRTIITYTSGTPATTTSYSIGKMGAQGTSGIIVSSTAPSSPTTGQLWQTAAGQRIQRWNGSAWVTHTFHADNISAANLSAISADLGTVTAGTIKGTNIEGANITGAKIVNTFTNVQYAANARLTGQVIMENGNIECKYTVAAGGSGSYRLDPISVNGHIADANGNVVSAFLLSVDGLTLQRGTPSRILTFDDLGNIPMAPRVQDGWTILENKNGVVELYTYISNTSATTNVVTVNKNFPFTFTSILNASVNSIFNAWAIKKAYANQQDGMTVRNRLQLAYITDDASSRKYGFSIHIVGTR